MIKMKYTEDSDDIEFPYCINMAGTKPIPVHQSKLKKKYIYLIIISCIIILGLLIFIIIYISQKKYTQIIIINYPQQRNKANYITAKYYINSNYVTLINLPENLTEPTFDIKQVGNEGRILEENINNIYNDSNIFVYNSSEKGVLTIEIEFMENIESISKMFQNCRNLYEVDFSNFISENIISMESTFLNCTSLETANFTYFNSSNIITMDNAFENCETLTELNLSSFEITHLETMNSMFKNCKNLFLLDISGFVLNKNISFNEAFSNLENLHIVYDNNNSLQEYIGENLNDINEDCITGENELCKNCREEENKKYTCGACNDGYIFLNVQNPTKCKKKCFVNNCNVCKNYYSCDVCIDGYLLENDGTNCTFKPNNISTNISSTIPTNISKENSSIINL